MKKRWRITALLVALLCASGLAAAAWLGYLPPGKPDNARDFMARQLVRIRFGGPFRTDTERAIADLMPVAGDTDDLRQAYYRHAFETQCAQAREFIAANPAYASDPLPPLDEAASAAFSKAATVAKNLDDKYHIYNWDDFSKQAADTVARATFLRDSAELMPLLAQARPAPGKTLATRDPRFGDLKLPEHFSLPARAALARAWFLSADGKADQAVDALKEVTGFVLSQAWSGLALGSLMQVVHVGLVYEKGVLPFAAKGLLSIDDLRELSDIARLGPFDPLQAAEMEFRFSLLYFAHSKSMPDMDAQMWRTVAEADFERHGPTSLDKWHQQQTSSDIGGRWPATKAFHERLAGKGPDLLHPIKAEELLDDVAEEPALDNQLRAMRQAAEARAEIEAYMVAAKLHEMRLEDPKNWLLKSFDATAALPLVIALPFGDGVEVSASINHPLLDRMSGKLLLRVR